MIALPVKFIENISVFLKDETEAFQNALAEPLDVSVHCNKNKPTHALPIKNNVPWSKNSYYLIERPLFTTDPYFHAGHYYVQEASSMILSAVFDQLNLGKGIHILDMCAAPGGKSLLLLDQIDETGFLHAHDATPLRAEILRQNLVKWGHMNCLITTGNSNSLLKSGMKYDLILLDAPCSGEGMFRKEKEAINQWNDSKVNYCSKIQNELIQIAAELCKENGYIIYSTCTYNTLENESVTQILDTTLFESIPFCDAQIYNLHQLNENNHYRCFPHRIHGEGFTFKILQKKSSANQTILKKWSSPSLKNKLTKIDHLINVPFDCSIIEFKRNIFASHALHAQIIQIFINSNIAICYFGCCLGEQKGDDFIPSHDISQSIYLNKTLPTIELDLKQSLDYLRANTLPIIRESKEKWLLVKYNEAILGWVKNNRVNLKNYYPKNQRIISY